MARGTLSIWRVLRRMPPEVESLWSGTVQARTQEKAADAALRAIDTDPAMRQRLAKGPVRGSLVAVRSSGKPGMMGRWSVTLVSRGASAIERDKAVGKGALKVLKGVGSGVAAIVTPKKGKGGAAVVELVKGGVSLVAPALVKGGGKAVGKGGAALTSALDTLDAGKAGADLVTDLVDDADLADSGSDSDSDSDGDEDGDEGGDGDEMGNFGGDDFDGWSKTHRMEKRKGWSPWVILRLESGGGWVPIARFSNRPAALEHLRRISQAEEVAVGDDFADTDIDEALDTADRAFIAAYNKLRADPKAADSAEAAEAANEAAQALVDTAQALDDLNVTLRETRRSAGRQQRNDHRRLLRAFHKLAGAFFRDATTIVGPGRPGRPVQWEDVIRPPAEADIGPDSYGSAPVGAAEIESEDGLRVKLSPEATLAAPAVFDAAEVILADIKRVQDLAYAFQQEDRREAGAPAAPRMPGDDLLKLLESMGADDVVTATSMANPKNWRREGRGCRVFPSKRGTYQMCRARGGFKVALKPTGMNPEEVVEQRVGTPSDAAKAASEHYANWRIARVTQAALDEGGEGEGGGNGGGNGGGGGGGGGLLKMLSSLGEIGAAHEGRLDANKPLYLARYGGGRERRISSPSHPGTIDHGVLVGRLRRHVTMFRPGYNPRWSIGATVCEDPVIGEWWLDTLGLEDCGTPAQGPGVVEEAFSVLQAPLRINMGGGYRRAGVGGVRKLKRRDGVGARPRARAFASFNKYDTTIRLYKYGRDVYKGRVSGLPGQFHIAVNPHIPQAWNVVYEGRDYERPLGVVYGLDGAGRVAVVHAASLLGRGPWQRKGGVGGRSYPVTHYIETILSDGRRVRDSWLPRWGRPSATALHRVVKGSPVSAQVRHARLVTADGAVRAEVHYGASGDVMGAKSAQPARGGGIASPQVHPDYDLGLHKAGRVVWHGAGTEEHERLARRAKKWGWQGSGVLNTEDHGRLSVYHWSYSDPRGRDDGVSIVQRKVDGVDPIEEIQRRSPYVGPYTGDTGAAGGAVGGKAGEEAAPGAAIPDASDPVYDDGDGAYYPDGSIVEYVDFPAGGDDDFEDGSGAGTEEGRHYFQGGPYRPMPARVRDHLRYFAPLETHWRIERRWSPNRIVYALPNGSRLLVDANGTVLNIVGKDWR